MSDSSVAVRPTRSWLPWRRRDEGIREDAEIRAGEILEAAAGPRKLPSRQGYVAGIPIGGATELNQAGSTTPDVVDRQTFLEQLSQAYLACPWASACVDVIARTCTAGGLEIVPDDEEADHDPKHLPAQVRKVKDLLAFVNPYEDIRQLLRGAITDLLVYGDAFIEVQYLLGEPIALYSLDAPSMRILADEHGNVTGYVQNTDSNQRAEFGLDEVVHISMDTPRGGLYGVGPTEKNLLPITLWIFTTALLKDLMKMGNPPRLHVDWPLSLSEPELKRQRRQYQVRNLGSRNVGSLFETQGGAKVQDLAPQNLQQLMLVADQARDTGVTGYGVPPNKVGIIESGNLGGGTGTSQDKTFKVNICGPIEEILLEKLTYAIIRRGFNIDGWHFQLGEVDWRDDAVIEDIRDKRIRNATWTINRARRDAGEPEVDGGDDPVLVDRQNIVLVRDLAAMSQATVAAKGAPGALTAAADEPGDDEEPADDDGTQPANEPSGPGARQPRGGKGTAGRKPPAEGESRPPRGPVEEAAAVETAWRRSYQARRRQALRELPREPVSV